MAYSAHASAVIEAGCEIGDETRIWHFAHIRTGARIGPGCVIGKGVFVDADVVIGRNVKIQNEASVFHGVTVGNGVFIGPHVCFTNDRLPRAVMPDMSARGEADWEVSPTTVEDGVSIGANATIVAGITLGQWSMVGAGCVVTKSVPPFALVLGNPGRLAGVVAPSGEVVARTYAAGRYSTSDGRAHVDVLPEWVPKPSA